MRRSATVVASLALLVTGCADGTNGSTPVTGPDSSAAGPAASEPLPAAMQLLLSGRHPAVSDTFEVWVCHVPDTTTDPIYLAGGARLDLTPDNMARRLEASVPTYFADISGGTYRPGFVPGGEVTIEPSDDHQACIEQALDGSGDTADAVYVVADAEHGGDESGGSAQPGSGCDCPARTSRRMVYVGASDFEPAWGATPAVDLTEHEIGHTLGLPHSGDALVAGASHEYTSALDVMSNSAAPRDADPASRHAPATIAANLLALGWLAPSDAVVVAPAGSDIILTPSNLGTDPAPLVAESVPRGKSVGLVVLDDFRLLTVELLVPVGHDSHLPEAGIAVHLIDQSPAACGHDDGSACTGLERHQVVLGSAPPHTDLLTAGESLTAEGWTIRVESLTATDGETRATVRITPG